MELSSLLTTTHQRANQDKQKGIDYRRAFLQHLLPALENNYGIKLTTTEKRRFEKSLWATVDLWKETQGMKNLGEFLHVVHRFTDYYIQDNKTQSRIERN